MRKTFLLLFIFVTVVLNGQVKFTNEEISKKNDSILAEGNLLYQYEKVAWVSTDIALELSDIKKKYGGYFIYQSGDTVKAIILDKQNENCIYEMSYLHNFTTPVKELFDIRPLNINEIKLISIKNKLIKQVFTPHYAIAKVEGYNMNVQLIPSALGYKLYLMAGTTKADIIPFGNDYIFFADQNGDITSWRKFHSRLIPAFTKYQGEKVSGVTHSHLAMEPFITATDICTFKLYGSIAGLKNFIVFSTALSKVFTYDLEKNTIEVKGI